MVDSMRYSWNINGIMDMGPGIAMMIALKLGDSRTM